MGPALLDAIDCILLASKLVVCCCGCRHCAHNQPHIYCDFQVPAGPQDKVRRSANISAAASITFFLQESSILLAEAEHMPEK
jgi:hypothetical protein